MRKESEAAAYEKMECDKQDVQKRTPACNLNNDENMDDSDHFCNFGMPKNYKSDFKPDLSPENTHGGKRVNAGRKVSLLGKSDNHTVTLHQKQDEYLRNKFGTLSKALKSLLPKKLQ